MSAGETEEESGVRLLSVSRKFASKRNHENALTCCSLHSRPMGGAQIIIQIIIIITIPISRVTTVTGSAHFRRLPTDKLLFKQDQYVLIYKHSTATLWDFRGKTSKAVGGDIEWTRLHHPDAKWRVCLYSSSLRSGSKKCVLSPWVN